MSRCSIAFGLTLCLSASVFDAAAQDVRRSAPMSASAAGAGQALGKKQIDLVRRVSAYFNQITNLKGTFLQTSADNQRLRGYFHISRPGRFRFEFNPPSRVVILANGHQVAIQDHDLNTDDRWELSYTPFRALLKKDVDLLRDARIVEVNEADDMMVVVFEDRDADTSGRITLFMALKPTLQIKAWITRDAQGLDTRVDLTEVSPSEEPDARLFDPALKLERKAR